MLISEPLFFPSDGSRLVPYLIRVRQPKTNKTMKIVDQLSPFCPITGQSIESEQWIPLSGGTVVVVVLQNLAITR